MTIFTLLYTDRADKDLEKLERADAQRIIKALERIKENPREHVDKLKTSSADSPIYSYHVGRRFRVLVQLLDDRLLVLVLEVHQRKTSYRDF